jgi:hypothetical protein
MTGAASRRPRPLGEAKRSLFRMDRFLAGLRSPAVRQKPRSEEREGFTLYKIVRSDGFANPAVSRRVGIALHPSSLVKESARKDCRLSIEY